jgi:haloacetate dehalogenase
VSSQGSAIWQLLLPSRDFDRGSAGDDVLMAEDMFPGFALDRVDAGGAVLRARHGGAGPPLLLLHGHPRTHATWSRVAPLLTDRHTVVCPDLRGYGESSKPGTTADHAPYSKRAMAGDCLALMRGPGHDQFAAAGHDRGSYVAFRLAMDHPGAVSHLAVPGSVPIGEALARCDATFAAEWRHWLFMGNPDAQAGRIINAGPDAWYQGDGHRAQIGELAWADYQRAIHDPATVTAMCEDNRAGLGIDRDHDDAGLAAGRLLSCPVLVLWATRDDMEHLHGDPAAIWHRWARQVQGAPIESGHHIAEEAPAQLAAALLDFLPA